MKWQEVGTFEAKTNLSKYLEKVCLGETIYITKHGRRIAELRPVSAKPKARRGSAQGKGYWMAPDFDAPLPEFSDY